MDISNEAENPSETETVISDDREFAETFNNFLVSIVPSLPPKENYEAELMIIGQC